MKTLYLLALAVVLAYADDDTCPNYGSWLPWTDKCLWFPFTSMRQDMIDACGVTVDNMDNLPTFPSPPSNFPTEPCGSCGFKFRCRKRAQTENCSPIDAEAEQCTEGSKADICTLPKLTVPTQHPLGCKYAILPMVLQQCANRPDIEDWRRCHAAKFSKITPKFHCVEDGDQCKCCCHPYSPNADGSACVHHAEPECDAFGDFNDWSDKCLFFPPAEMKKGIQEHCDFDFGKKTNLLDKLKLPDGVEMPPKCGYCSFKIKCRKRSPTSAAGKKECFPMDVAKMNCGNEQCEGCGDVCELPKLGGTCDYTGRMKKLVGPGIKSRVKKMPVHMRHGFIKMILGLPHGKCVEKGDKCACCCHPYEPNADGTACQLKYMCKTPEESGVEFHLNLPDDDSWDFLL